MSGKPIATADVAPPAAPVRQRPPGDLTPPRPAEDATAWTEYVAAARQLDGVRRSAATAATEQARAVRAAREELTTVRERLVPQRVRLRERGVSPMTLVPSPPELTEAARSMVGGPTAVLTALRTARGWADGADGVLAARGPFRPAAWPPRLRNLLVYGPLALVVPLLQVALHLATGTGPASVVALVLGVPMPVVAFVAGWITVGRLFGEADGPAPAGGSQDGVAAGHPTDPAPVARPGGTYGGGSALQPDTAVPQMDTAVPLTRAADGLAGAADGLAGAADGGLAGAAERPTGAAVSPLRAPGAPPAAGAGVVPVPAAGRPVDRTPRWGALVCLVPAVSTTAGLVLAMLAG